MVEYSWTIDLEKFGNLETKDISNKSPPIFNFGFKKLFLRARRQFVKGDKP